MEEKRGIVEQAPPKVEINGDEKTWAILAHLSTLLSVISGGLLGPAAAFAIWLIKKEESDYVAKQALQSLIYQIVAAVLSWLMWISIAVLSAIVVGICCMPAGILIQLAMIGYPCYAAYVCSLGQEFKYPLIGDMVGIE